MKTNEDADAGLDNLRAYLGGVLKFGLHGKGKPARVLMWIPWMKYFLALERK